MQQGMYHSWGDVARRRVAVVDLDQRPPPRCFLPEEPLRHSRLGDGNQTVPGPKGLQREKLRENGHRRRCAVALGGDNFVLARADFQVPCSRG